MIFNFKIFLKRIFILILVFILLIGITPFIQAQEAGKIKEKVLDAVKKRQKEVNFKIAAGVREVNLQNINRIVDTAVKESDDYYRFTVESWNINAKGDSQQSQINISFSYLSSRREDEYIFNQVKEIAAELFTSDMNKHQKVKAVNDYLISQLKYDETLRSETAYDALRSGITTCRGYALLTYLLLKEAGIENQIITGRLRGEPQLHAWNLIYLAGNWYHLDTTQNAVHYPEQKELIYGWYNLSNQAISSTHVWNLNNYPTAEKSYLEELERLTAVDPNKKEVYRDLIKNLNLHYLKAEYTAFEHGKFKSRVKEALVEKKKKISFRTTQELAAEINRVLDNLYRTNSNLPQIRNYNIRQANYNRDTYKNTILFIINFNY